MTCLYSLEELNEYQQRESVLAAWDEQEPSERLLFIKLLAGSFRSPLPEPLLIEALAELCNAEKTWVAHQLAGDWHPHGGSLEDLLSATSCPTAVSQPYPFFLAHQLEESLANLGDVAAGWPNGSGTASGRRWSGATANCSCGRGARSW
jgi:DNA ligase-1